MTFFLPLVPAFEFLLEAGRIVSSLLLLLLEPLLDPLLLPLPLLDPLLLDLLDLLDPDSMLFPTTLTPRPAWELRRWR